MTTFNKITALVIGAFMLLPLLARADEAVNPTNSQYPVFNTGFNMVHSGVQGMDIWGDYLISLQNYGICQVYKLNSTSSATRLGYFNLASYNNTTDKYNHANVATFSNQFYSASDKVPLLYVTRCHNYTDDDGMINVCYVERLDVDKMTSTLVQTICLKGSVYTGQYIMDLQNNYLYVWGNCKVSGVAKHYIRKFAIPEVGEGKATKVWLDEKDALECYYFEDYETCDYPVIQGGAIHNGLMYLPCGYDQEGYPSVMYIWDLKKKRLDKKLTLTGIFEGEFEDCSVNWVDNWLVIQANKNHVYFMSLEKEAGDWENFFCQDGIAYIVTDKDKLTCEVAGGVSYSGAVVIPGSVADCGKTYTVTGIGKNAFQNCTGLTALTLPGTLTYISDGAFDGCTALTTITSKIKDPSQCPCNSFTSTQKTRITLNVPYGKDGDYKATEGWQDFKTIKAKTLWEATVLNLDFKDGTIYKERGETTNLVGRVGSPSVQYSPDRSYSIGSTKLESTDGSTASYNGATFYYATFDKTDKVGQALANQFTIETVFRIDKAFSSAYNSSTGVWNHSGNMKILGCQGGGGFSISQNQQSRTWNSTTQAYLPQGLSTEYIYNGLAATDTWGVYNHVYTNKLLNQGEFYHVAVTVDKDTRTEKIYVNGELQTTAQLAGDGTFIYPNCGTTRRNTQMFFVFGGDAASEDTPTKSENPNASSFVYFKVYDEVLGDETIAENYKGNASTVKLTQPRPEQRLMDVQFAKDGTFSDNSSYGAAAIPYFSTITTELSTQNRYALVCNANSSNFVKRSYFYDADFCHALTNGYSLEVYASVPSGVRTSTISPLSGQEAGGGSGIQVLPDGTIKFISGTCGILGPSSYTYSANSANMSVAGKLETNRYMHYVVTFQSDPQSLNSNDGKATLYLDGKAVATKSFSGTITTDLPYAAWQWMCIGGDANATYGSSSCENPWIGNIALARVWGEPLTATDVDTLYQQAVNPTTCTITIERSGFGTACLPYSAVVPEGLEAYVVSAQNESTITLTKYASAGDIIPYGTPVIIFSKEAEKDKYCAWYRFLSAVNDEALAAPTVNLLKGTLAPMDMEAGAAYTLSSEADFTACTGTIPFNKAYLPNDGSTASSKTMTNKPTAIKGIQTDSNLQEGKGYFNLQGQKVSQPERGIFILNGKKVFVK